VPRDFEDVPRAPAERSQRREAAPENPRINPSPQRSRSVSPVTIHALQRAAGNRATLAYVQRLSTPPTPSAGASPVVGQAAETPIAPAASQPVEARGRPAARPDPGLHAAPSGPAGAGGDNLRTVGGGPNGGAAPGDPAQALTKLQGVESADFAANLAQTGPAVATDLATEHAAMTTQLPSRPTPTGLPIGQAPALAPPTEPQVPAVQLDADTAGDAGQAEELSSRGGAAVADAASSAHVEVPQAASVVHPSETPPPLPDLMVAPPPAVPAGPAPTQAAGDDRRALNATMNAEVHEMTTAAMAPALAAGLAHGPGVSAAKANAQASVATAEADSTAQQQLAATGADTEVRQLHAEWLQEKGTLVSSHQGQISTEASQVRAEATKTIADAHTQAKAQEEKQQPGTDQRDEKPGVWDTITSGARKALSAVGNVVTAGLSLVAGILAAAKQKVLGMLAKLGQVIRERIAAAVQALRDGVRRVGAAIAGAIQRARDLVGRLASALATAARRIWAAAKQRLAQMWARVTSLVSAALAAAANIAKRVAEALGKVKQIVGLLKNKFLGFMADAVGNPEEKIAKPFAAIGAPAAAGVPAKAEQEGASHVAGGPSAAPGATAQRATIQRALAPAPPAETFKDGVLRHAEATGQAFLEHWFMNLVKIVLSIIFFPITALMELPKLWSEIKGVFNPEPGGGDRLDHLLGAFRQIVNIAAVVIAGIGVWAFIIGLIFPLAEPFIGAGYYTLSMGVLAADLIVATAQMIKAYASASGASTAEEREMYLEMFAYSLIGFAITVIMVLLGAAAAKLSQVVRNIRAGAAAGGLAGNAAKVKVGPVDKPPAPVDHPPAPAKTTTPPSPTDRPSGMGVDTGGTKASPEPSGGDVPVRKGPIPNETSSEPLLPARRVRWSLGRPERIRLGHKRSSPVAMPWRRTPRTRSKRPCLVASRRSGRRCSVQMGRL
jgi:hypothetical protein